MTEQVELLFFDTFAHDNTEEINLDLVQFPKPVYVTEVRIIPLGARVQADFPGGVRLGATNPSQFQIEFFVNDLGKPGASTFETLGGFEYDQNGCINLECMPDESIRKIPTDGLVLKGWYTTITLAVYGTLTNNITEQIIQPVVNPALPAQPNTIADAQQIISGTTIEPEWQQEPIPSVPLDYNAQPAPQYHQPYAQTDSYSQEFTEYYSDVPKDPRSYHHTPESDWDSKGRTRMPEGERDRDRERTRESYQKTGGTDRDHGRSDIDRRDRDRERRYSRSESRDRERQSREYRDIDREREHDVDWNEHERPDYRSERSEHDWSERGDRGHDRDRDRSDRYKHDDYRRSQRGKKRPRTPPMQSPKRPHTPHLADQKDMPSVETEKQTEEDIEKARKDKEIKEESKTKSPVKEVKEVYTSPAEETMKMDVEEFEPILSDEDILDDNEHYQDIDYDYSTYTNNDDIIKLFVPGVTDLKKYPKLRSFMIKNNCIEIEDSLKVAVGIADDYFKSSITKYVVETFDKLNTEIKEEFIHLCEKLISTIGPSTVFCDIAKLYVDTKSMNPQSLNKNDKELTEQVHCIIETVMEWLKIALNYELANIQDQPAYKIRHIKCGIRLADWCCTSLEFIKIMWQTDFNIHKELMNLYEQEFMALSIKLMILKTLDTYLHHKFAIEKFLLGTTILQKMHSILIKLRNVSYDIPAEEINLITKSLNEILNFCQCDPFTVYQPKRFLPVSSQFEILRSSTNNILVEYFKMFNLLQCFLLLLTYPSTLNLPLIKTPIFEIISTLLDSVEGLQYLSENCDTLNVLLKCLLRTDEELQYGIQECIEERSHYLGLRIAYKIQALYHIECLSAIGKKYNFDYDASEIIDEFHGLFCLSFSPVGKVCSAEVLGMNDNIRCLLPFLEGIFLKDKSESQLIKIKKSPGIAYIIDLITLAVTATLNVTLLEKHSKFMFQVINQQDIFDDAEVNKLRLLHSYLIPFENGGTLEYDNISAYVDIIDKQIENLMGSIGPITTSLRIIQHLGISKYSQRSAVISDNPLGQYIELKYKHVILQLFSLDGMTILSRLLQKICEHFDQPSLHSSIFVSNQGIHILNIIDHTISLLKQMLAYVIQCRNVNFKDLTTIPIFLQTYNLLNSYPSSAPGYSLSQTVRTKITDALLVYTQPVSDEVKENDSLNKTLWTQMCGEVIKYSMSSPHTFISGLLIFSELLPLPLPVQTGDDLSKDEISWIINLRKLWSAHLHPHTGVIQEMINKLCISTQPQLLNLLRRICVQISDLAANSAIMIARGILDNVYNALIPKEDTKIGPCNSYVARLLNFLACLVTHNTIKCAVLYLLHTNTAVTLKTDEKYVTLIPAFAQVIKNNFNTNSHVQSQECILSIIQSFCDIEITLMQHPVDGFAELSSETYIANAMPIKEHLLLFIHMMGEHLMAENSFVTYLPIVRTLLLLTEHDYGFYHLKEYLLKKADFFSVLLNNLANNFSPDNAECLSTLNTLVEFLRVCVTTDEETEPNLCYTARKIKLTLGEMKALIGWPAEDKKPESHHLITVENILKKVAEENNTFESFLEGVSSLLKLLDDNPPEEPKETFLKYSADACDERLTARYWLAVPSEEEMVIWKTVTCDILEICRQNLKQDYNLVKELMKN
ncbi:hypothetical protein NQ317_014175 [Molorchus minor]|uniref:Virilizer N-terminal domain-containing protein n=1 Tax=Molorchus minor TaxID=1323400 RepID=A0ABQ9JJ75_9CUCU|nr:hypothetical protein NQ317_014175 [Molorchus minor]